MNCIQPIAPAELGPMLRPKFDSILLIAPSTCQGTSYAAPARCQSARSALCESCCGAAGGDMIELGTATVPATFGTSLLGSVRTDGELGSTAKTSARATPVITPRQSATASSARRRTDLPGGSDPEAEALGGDRLAIGHGEDRGTHRLELGGLGLDGRRLGLRGGSGLGGCGIGRALALDRLFERDEEVVLVRRGVRGDLAVDVAGEDVRDQ